MGKADVAYLVLFVLIPSYNNCESLVVLVESFSDILEHAAVG